MEDLENACRQNDTEHVKELIMKMDYSARQRAMITIISHTGDLDLVKFTYSSFMKRSFLDYLWWHPTIYSMDYYFAISCKYNRKAVAQWILQTETVNVHSMNEYGFCQAVENGHLEILDWLYAQDVTWTMAKDMFVDVCNRSDIKMMEYLYEKIKPNQAFLNRTYSDLCYQGTHLACVWLHAMGAELIGDQGFEMDHYDPGFPTWFVSVYPNYQYRIFHDYLILKKMGITEILHKMYPHNITGLQEKFTCVKRSTSTTATCPVCYDCLSEKDNLSVACQHLICIDCLLRLKQDCCPLCRRKYKQEEVILFLC